MKKCASCTKDLPDAALHCVFCGAKQPPAPASPPATAKTVMGYGGPELDALRAQAAAQNAARSGAPSAPPANVPAPAPAYNPPRAANPSAPPPMAPSYSPPSGPTPLAPAAGANSPTMFVQQGPSANQGPSMGGPMQSGPTAAGSFNVPPPSAQTLATAEANRLPMPSAQPLSPPAPMTPSPVASPPYLASQTAARAGRPVEPWKDSIRTMLFIWGGLLILAFVAPLSTDPMVFNWDIIINGEGTQKLPPLIMAAVGLLSIVMAAIPLASGARGAIALLLGLTGIFVPMLLNGMPPWQMLLAAVGLVLVPMGLLARNEYRDAMLPRVLVTVGALCYLALWLVPAGDKIPLVELFSGLVDAPGAFKIIMILLALQVVLIVLSLLCWLPAPASGGAKVIAWMLIVYPLIMFAAMLFLIGDPSLISKSPATALAWVWGGGMGGDEGGGAMFAGITLGVAYLALTSYGGATVLGKSLE